MIKGIEYLLTCVFSLENCLFIWLVHLLMGWFLMFIFCSSSGVLNTWPMSSRCIFFQILCTLVMGLLSVQNLKFYAAPLLLFSGLLESLSESPCPCLYLQVFYLCFSLARKFQSFRLVFSLQLILYQSWSKVRLWFHFCMHGNSLFLDHLLKSHLFPSVPFWNLVENYVAVWVGFCIFYSIPLVYKSISVQVLNCFWGKKKGKS